MDTGSVYKYVYFYLLCFLKIRSFSICTEKINFFFFWEINIFNQCWIVEAQSHGRLVNIYAKKWAFFLYLEYCNCLVNRIQKIWKFDKNPYTTPTNKSNHIFRYNKFMIFLYFLKSYLMIFVEVFVYLKYIYWFGFVPSIHASNHDCVQFLLLKLTVVEIT